MIYDILIQKPHAAFGYVIYLNDVVPKKEYETVVDETSTTTLYYFDGSLTFKDKETNEICLVATPGLLIESIKQRHGKYYTYSENGCKFFCLDKKVNNNFFPKLKPVNLNKSENYFFEKGTKFYFCFGSLITEDNKILVPGQIYFKNNNEKVLANENSYGLIFE